MRRPLVFFVLLQAAGLALCLAGTSTTHAQAQIDAPSQQQAFEIPFVQVTDGMASCPAQHAPVLTPEEVRAQSHYRAERGVSCYQSGRCRLPNAYLYDAEIIPRVKQVLISDGRFAQTRIWAEGQRRWVWLKGCVQSREQAQWAEQLVRQVDDVEAVINELTYPTP
jgi:hypothetical protein